MKQKNYSSAQYTCGVHTVAYFRCAISNHLVKPATGQAVHKKKQTSEMTFYVKVKY